MGHRTEQFMRIATERGKNGVVPPRCKVSTRLEAQSWELRAIINETNEISIIKEY